MNPGFGTCYPLPHRDSQGRQTAASMRLGGNQKAKPSRGEGRERTGGRAATEPQTRCWRGPKEADHGATEPRLCSPWLGGPHTPSSVKQFKNWKIWPPHLQSTMRIAGGRRARFDGQCVWRGLLVIIGQPCCVLGQRGAANSPHAVPPVLQQEVLRSAAGEWS